MAARRLAVVLAGLILVLGFRVSAAAQVNVQEPGQGQKINLMLLNVDSQAYPQVSVALAAWDENGSLAGLQKDNFQVFVEKANEVAGESDTSIIEVTPEPIQDLQLVVALDTSVPEQDFAELQTAVKRLITLGNGRDKIALITFSDEIKRVVPDFTNNTETLNTAVTALHASGSNTALYQAIGEAAALVNQAPAGRKAVVLVTDRHDNVGNSSLAQVIETARATQVPFYIIGFGDQVQRQNDIKEWIRSTSGQYLTVNSSTQVWPALQTTYTGLKEGYKLTFSARLAADNNPHRLHLRLSRAERQVEAQGEFVATPGEVVVSLPSLPPMPLRRGTLSLVPDIKAPSTIVGVTYGLDDQPLAEVQAPFIYTWDSSTTPPGEHKLIITATDQVGNTGQLSTPLILAAPVEVSILTAPPAQIEFGRPITIAADIQGQEALKVDMLVNGNLQQRLDHSPYVFNLPKEIVNSSGPVTVTIRAEDELGQTDQANLFLEILPKPSDLTWLQQVGQNIHIAPPYFERAINIIFHFLVACLAGLLLFIIALGVRHQLRLIRLRHRLEQQQRYPLEVVNEGNAASEYDLWARDEDELLSLQFSFNDLIAYSFAYVQPVTGVGPAPTTRRPDLATPPQPAPVSPNGENWPQPIPRWNTASVGKPQEYATPMVRLLGILGQLLPGFLGRPFRLLSSQLRAGQSAVRRATQVPIQMNRQVNRVRQEISRLAPGSSRSAGTSPTVLPDRQEYRGSINAAPPPPIVPEWTGLPAPTPPSPTIERPNPLAIHSFAVDSNPIRTPPLEPGETMLLDLTIIPHDPYQTRTYPLSIVTNAVEQAKYQPTWTQEAIEITGFSGYRRYRPVVVLASMVGIFSLVIMLAAIWLVGFDLATWLTIQGQRWIEWAG